MGFWFGLGMLHLLFASVGRPGLPRRSCPKPWPEASVLWRRPFGLRARELVGLEHAKNLGVWAD